MLIGVNDDGSRCGLKATDELLLKLSAIRTDGNILPLPVMSVDYIPFEDGDVIVVEVVPSILPPVRYRGRTFIRISARKDIATREEEDILVERRSANFPTFDTTPCPEATLEDIDTELITRTYLPRAINPEVLAQDTRSLKEQLAALRLYDLKNDHPTNAAIILFGKRPEYFLLGNYIQFVRFKGVDNAAVELNLALNADTNLFHKQILYAYQQLLKIFLNSNRNFLLHTTSRVHLHTLLNDMDKIYQ